MSSASPAPRTPAEVGESYQSLRAQHQHRHDALSVRRSRALQALLVAVMTAVWQTLHPLRGAAAPALWLVLAAVFVGLIWYSMRQQNRITREQRLLTFYDRSLRRAEGSEVQSGRTGLEDGQSLSVSGHLYERDLDILGPDSLFGLLATVRTGPGERGLARYLLEPATHEETRERQASVQELLPRTELREEIALLGSTSFHQISASFFDEWLAEAPPVIHPAYRFILAITATISLALLFTGLLHVQPWRALLPNLALVFAIQIAVSLVLRSRVMPLLTASGRLQQHIRLIADGLALMQAGTFDSPKLKHLQRLSFEPAGAVKLLKKLHSHLAIVEQRTKEYFYILSLLLAAGTQAAISIAAWKRKNAGAMRQWLDAWAEFEALNALATYAFEHPCDGSSYAWPELLPADRPPLYEARDLGHPLLANAVTNDIALGRLAVPHSSQPHPEEREDAAQSPARFFLISGSNMAGKSTLLRSIGINAVLAYAGAPVRAASLRLTPLAIGASLALTDSLAEGRSKFLAEVERLSAIVRLSSSARLSGASPVLFLVDEIFSGTNSEDRRTAARAVLEKLLANGAIGALSTHDLALTDLATPANGGVNVHMASPDPDDPLAFDYRLKPGVNTASNALAIVRMMGL